MTTEGPVSTLAFMQSRQVFTLAEAHHALKPQGSMAGMRERLKHYVRTRRLRAVTRGVYAAVPYAIAPERFQPDAYLVGAAMRADAVFAYYSAIVLLGAARVEWNVVTVLTSRRRPALDVGSVRVDFASQPPALVNRRQTALGVRTVDRLGRSLRVTGPERTLVDGFRHPGRVGGIAELVAAAAGFSVLDLDLVARVLRAYDEKTVWAAVGWFLERHRSSFSVPEAFLRQLERRRPKSRVYLVRGEGRGRLARRWNLMLPESVAAPGEPDER
jgi:predicted transcriptional regulator of viral defense system